MKKHFSKISAVFGLMALVASAACENIAIIKRPTPQLDGDEIVGEITGIDLRVNQIYVRSTEDGRRATPQTIRLEENTQLLYRGREYPLSSLEVGDIVALQVRDRQRGSSTNLLRLEQSSKDRQARQSGAGSQRIEGTVERIDLDNGAFELRERSGNNVRVSLSPNAHAPVAEQVHRLRRGDQVLAEGRFLSRERFELEDLL
jgi:predicted RNA-binding protein